MADTLFDIAAIIMLISLVMAMIRLLIGPTAADRAVALDSMTVIALSLIGWIALTSGRIIYMDGEFLTHLMLLIISRGIMMLI